MSRRWKQLITSFCLMLIVGVGLLQSQPSLAASVVSAAVPVPQGGLFTYDVGLNLNNTKVSIDHVIQNMIQAMIRNALNAFLGKIAYDSAVYLASGGEGQGSLVFDQPVGEYLNGAADAAAGGAIEGLATGAGLSAQGLCDPGSDFRIALTLGLDVNAKSPYRPACTLSKLAGNWSEAFSNKDFTKLLALQFDPTANPLGIALEAGDITAKASYQASEEAKIKRMLGGVTDKTQLVSGTILTPGEMIREQTAAVQHDARLGWTQTIGNPVADAISVFTSTLASKWLQRFQNGIANLSNGSSLAGIVSGQSSGASTGRGAAEATFAALRQPAFSASGAFDVLAELGNCPSDSPTATDGTEQQLNNCAIGSSLQIAITDKWTVQQFVDYLADNGNSAFSFGQTTISATFVTGNIGITEKGVLLLKKYRIVPVGWELAAEYIKDKYPGNEPSLQNLVDCYNACGTSETTSCPAAYLTVSDGTTNYSPFCKLIDPDWVLKAPQNFCEREAAGPDFATITSFENGNAATQDTVLYSRLNYCADNRSCIQEQTEDVCTAYGYCTAESPIYRFNGTSCPAYYSSCQTYTNSDGDEQSFIKSSINYNDCATDPGCQWYCLSTNDSGNFDCAGSSSTFVSCDETTSDSYDITYATNESCSCSLTETCTVLAGSDLGYDGGDPTGEVASAISTDGIYDYWQCPIINSDGSTTVCALDSTCGAGSPNYDPNTETCTCNLTNTCSVAAGVTTCAIGETGNPCTLEETNANGCDSTDASYSSAPTCTAAGTGYLNCGDICTVAEGDTGCVNSLGNTCIDGDTDTSDGAIDRDGRVDGSCTLADSCAIASGGYSCTSAAGNNCVIGVVQEDPAQSNDTLYFDNNAVSCDSSDAGCQQYIRQLSDTNLITNSYFDYYSGSTTDSNQDYLAFCSNDGQGCYTNTDCNRDADGIDPPESTGTCVGWNQDNASALVLTTGSFSTPRLGTNFVRLINDTSIDGDMEMVVDTGHSLSNRTFTFAYSASSLQANDTTCALSFTIGDVDGHYTKPVTSFLTAAGTTASSYYSTDWQNYFVTYTFPAERLAAFDIGTAIRVSIAESNCDIDIDGAYLAETDSFSGNYSNYGNNNVTYLNSDTVSCEPADVGCELYTEVGKTDAQGVPGIITNPNSDACLGTCSDNSSVTESDCTAAGETWDAAGYNYASPSCNQCDGDVANGQVIDYYNGCGFYQEVALDNTTPVVTDETWLDDTSERPGVVKRSGSYCSNDSATHCFEDADCTAAGATCQDQLSIVPASATQCAAADVGCAAYTNLDQVSQGGEGLEYYSQLKQCVKTNDPDIATYHTFEGSDAGGIQINDYLLKKTINGAPCTHLDLSSEEYNAVCTDGTTSVANDCGPNGDNQYGINPDCRQFIDDSGNVYYRYESEVVEASESCIPLRNADDTRVYYAITSSSDSCSETAVGCREYRGTNTGSAQDVVNTGFDDNSTTDWAGASSTSNESPLSTGYSLLLQNADNITYDLFDSYTNSQGVSTNSSLLTAGDTYVLNFWAKAEGVCSDTTYITSADCTKNHNTWTASTATFGIDLDSTVAGTDYYFTKSGMTTSSSDATVTLDNTGIGIWQFYQLGPIILPTSANVTDANEQLVITFNGANASSNGYLDNVIVTQSDSQYLVQDTANTCISFEGCRAYDDRANDTHYLKSFQRLCDEGSVGCEAMIDTANSTNPYTEAYNVDNEYDADDVIVQYDQPVTLVYNEDNLCSQSAMGCSELGLPTVDDRTGAVSDYTSTYVLNRPDDYASILCQQQQLSCREFTSDYDGTAYFKDPGEKICVLQDYTDSAGLALQGWFKQDSTSTQPDCPVQYSYDSSSQPLGGVCNSNSVHHDTDPTVVLSQKVGLLCNQDADCYPDGWTGTDPTPRCISSLADDVDIYDGGVHQFVAYPDDGVTLSDTSSNLDVTLGHCSNPYILFEPLCTSNGYTWIDGSFAFATAIGDNFGWVGICPSAQSGCSEYVDPYSPNIDEINYNWSFENDVRNSTLGTYYSTSETPDGFPDYWGVTAAANADAAIDLDLDGTLDFDATCSNTTASAVMTNSVGYTGSAVAPNDGGSALALTDCVVDNSHFIIDPAKLYTLRSFIKLPSSAYADDANNEADTPIEFSIGLHYYDSDDNQIRVTHDQTFVVADHATIDSADYVDASNDGHSQWYRWEGNIGLGSSVEWPTNAVSASVFIANHSTTTMYFDAVSIKENDKYYYIDYTVDGTAEREATDGSNSCINQSGEAELTSDGGCVAFRDVTSDTQSYSQEGLADCTNCLLTPNSDSCRNIVNACDTNAVLKVQPDRICSEWIGCDFASVVTDESGNETAQCFMIKPCNALDSNGRCSNWVQKPTYDELNSLTDIAYTTSPGDTDSLSGLRGVTGNATAGLTWAATRTCLSGEHAGEVCSADNDCSDTPSCNTMLGTCSNNSSDTCLTDSDCESAHTCTAAFSTAGYYPYGFMVEVGNDGAAKGKDLIEMGDFENLYCAGTDADPSLKCISNATTSGVTTASAEAGNCFSTNIEQAFLDTTATSYPVGYVAGQNFADLLTRSNDEPFPTYFCPNSPDFQDYWPFRGYDQGNSNVQYTKNGWQKSGADTTMEVSQYTAVVPDCGDNCPSLDVNNVLEITPGSGSFSGGAVYDLADNISPAPSSYVLSFDGRYLTAPVAVGDGSADPSTMSVCLRYVNSTGGPVFVDNNDSAVERKDCFVDGLGAADVVFIIDSSSSMGSAITNIKNSISAISSELISKGVDAQFALVDLETDNDIDRFNTLRLNFTADVSVVTDVLTNDIVADHAESTNGYKAIDQVINNNIHDATLNWRPTAQPIVVLVTDGHSSPPQTNYEPETLATLLQAEGDAYPLMVVTDSADDADAWQPYADYTGGDVSDQMNADWTSGNNSVLDDIVRLVVNSVDVFQMDTTMRHYSFGPLTTSQRADDSAATLPDTATVTANLEILLSDTHTIQLDNVSLMPGLEVNKDLGTIGRTCRAYPDATSAQCDYIVPAGGNYQGWKGYCLQIDPTNNARCLTWWPQDILNGEESIVSRNAAGYTDSGGRSNVYSCLVSKGLSKPGFCDVTTFNAGYYDTGYDADHVIASVELTNADGELPISDIENNLANSTALDFGQDVLCTGDTACSAVGGSCFQGANYLVAENSNGEHDAAIYGADITESLTTNGGTCQLDNTREVPCDSWPLDAPTCIFPAESGIDADPGDYDETTCEPAGGAWTSVVDIIATYGEDSSGIIRYGDNATDNIFTQSNDFMHPETYNDQSDDPALDENNDLCFYDIDGDGIYEIRSTKVWSGSSQDGCGLASGEVSSDYSCAPMQCEGSDEHKACTVTNDPQCETISAAVTTIPYYVRPLRWQMPDPYDHNYGELNPYPHTSYSGYGYANGVIVRLPANEILRNINVSEMESILYDAGSAGSGSPGGSPCSGVNGEEYFYWGQCNGQSDDPASPNYKVLWLSDFTTGSIRYDETGARILADKTPETFDTCYWHDDNDAIGGIFGFGCRIWGLWDSGFKESGYSSLPTTGEHVNDIVYTFGWSNFEYSREYGSFACQHGEDGGESTRTPYRYSSLKDEDNSANWVNSDCVNNTIKALLNVPTGGTTAAPSIGENNPWEQLDSQLAETVFSPVTSESALITYFDESDITSSDLFATSSSAGDGGNLLSLFIDFNDQGYIQAVYVMEYFDADYSQDEKISPPAVGVETTWDNMMSLAFQTRESCALISNDVDGSGDNYAWSDRTTAGSYDIHTGTADAYGRVDLSGATADPYGSISPLDNNPTVDSSWDAILTDPDTLTNTLTYGTQAIATGGENPNAGHPLACIGDCTTRGCVGSPNVVSGYTNPETQEQCTTNPDCGDKGVCMGVGVTDSSINNNGQSTASNNLDSQLKEVSKTGVSNLKHVFAGFHSSTPFYRLIPGGTSLYDNLGSDYWSTLPGDSAGLNYFSDVMVICAGSLDAPGQRTEAEGTDGEYCGVLPRISVEADGGTGISIDGFSGGGDDVPVANGHTVQLAFTSITNEEQLVLHWVNIDWGDGTEAQPLDWGADDADFVFTHDYNCTPGNPNDEDSVDTTCTFTPKITLVDNWGWCSGNKPAEGVTDPDHRLFIRPDTVQALQQDCGTYDDPGFSVVVSGQ